MDKLREAGLKMKLSKCAFFRKEMLYLGHKISREGISTDPSKVDVVSKWSTPATVPPDWQGTISGMLKTLLVSQSLYIA